MLSFTDMQEQQTIFVGLSGGVDSSVAASRLIQQGHNVVGVFIKTWHPDFIKCNWEKERLDAMRVAAYLDIPFLTCDAEDSYKNDVAEYMISEYREGRTPNPDVMCNKFVKFDTFLNFALDKGADMVATGHYARTSREGDIIKLQRSIDKGKDQSYFLWTLTQEQLSHILFPIGDTDKKDIRNEAEKVGLPTFAKQDSQGICFLGDIDVKEFLSHYISTEYGSVLDEGGNVIGRHAGALFYTTGQRHGFEVRTSGAKSNPLFVIGRDLEDNTITVSNTSPKIAGNKIEVTDINEISDNLPERCQAQFRYRQKPFNVSLEKIDTAHVMLTVLEGEIDTPSVGQSCVFYKNEECLGGGIIRKIK